MIKPQTSCIYEFGRRNKFGLSVQIALKLGWIRNASTLLYVNLCADLVCTDNICLYLSLHRFCIDILKFRYSVIILGDDTIRVTSRWKKFCSVCIGSSLHYFIYLSAKQFDGRNKPTADKYP